MQKGRLCDFLKDNLPSQNLRKREKRGEDVFC